MEYDKCRCECKNPKKHRVWEKYYIWNSATCSCKNGKHLASIIDDSVITCDEITDTTKSILTKTVPAENFAAKSNSKNFDILPAFLLITALLMAVSIYCYLMKYRAKEKNINHLL